MNSLVILTFTERGYLLGGTLAEKLRSGAWQGSEAFQIQTLRVTKLAEAVRQYFRQGNVLIFIGAAGIAVRAIAPLIQSKASDPAVLVVDERAEYVIPILSGHIGGANEFARRAARMLGAAAVITTATDVNGVFAIDTFAARSGYHIVNPEAIKEISSALLSGKEVGLWTDLEVTGSLPSGFLRKDSGEVGVCIACGDKGGISGGGGPFQKTLYLIPKCFHVGIGARKDADTKRLEDLFAARLAKLSIPAACVCDISSIDVKKDEPAILALTKTYQIPYITYSADELSRCETLFESSDFVKKTVGAGSVCEAAAYLSAGSGTLVQKKHAQDGFTIAIAARRWKVEFEGFEKHVKK